jgi:hypothetical protein
MNIVFLLLLLNYYFILNAKDKKDDFLMGSVVKSDEWVIDKKKDREIFKRNVSFKNSFYIMKTDYAVYDRKNKIWNADGNVYARRNFENNSYMESYSEKAEYNENLRRLILFSEKTKIKTVFYDGLKKETFISYSKESTALIDEKKIIMEKEFELLTASMTAYSQKAIYDDNKKEFELIKDPKVFGQNDEYATFINANLIYVNRENKTVKAINNVYGKIERKKL